MVPPGTLPGGEGGPSPWLTNITTRPCPWKRSTRWPLGCYYADSITNAAGHDMEKDIRLAARIVSDLATLRFHIAALAAATTDENTARSLRKLIGLK